MAQIIAYHSGRPFEQVERDIDRDYFMTAQQAREYGLIDEVITPRRGISAELLAAADHAAAQAVDGAPGQLGAGPTPVGAGV
jgi:hypothetical protein